MLMTYIASIEAYHQMTQIYLLNKEKKKLRKHKAELQISLGSGKRCTFLFNFSHDNQNYKFYMSRVYVFSR